MKTSLPRSEQIDIQRIYDTVEHHVTLDSSDWEPSAEGTTDPRWKRNVRNILQHRKTTSEVIWLGNGVYMIPPSRDPSVVNSTLPGRSKMTKEEFTRLQIARSEVGNRGEEFVVAYERNKLAKAGRTDLAARVVRTSLTNVGAGYDVESLDSQGRQKFIEVKTTVGHGSVFEWSGNEYEVAKELGDRYWIYCVRDIGNNPVVLEIQNPASRVGSELDVRPNSYVVRLVKNLD